MLADSVYHHEVVAQTVHLGKLQFHDLLSDSAFAKLVYSWPAERFPMSTNKSIRSRFNQLKSHPRWVRIPLGVILVLGGIFGALPVLGFWMLPLGLILLSVDFPWARRALAHLKLWWRKLKNRYRQYFGKQNQPG